MPASIEKFIRIAGVILAIGAGFSLLFCLALIGTALEKRYSVIQSVGYWPLFTLFLLLLSAGFIFGAPRLARAIGKKESDENKLA